MPEVDRAGDGGPLKSGEEVLAGIVCIVVESIDEDRLLCGRRKNFVNEGERPFSFNTGVLAMESAVGVVGVSAGGGSVPEAGGVCASMVSIGDAERWNMWMSSSSSASDCSPSSELSPSSSNSGPPWCERTVPIPSVWRNVSSTQFREILCLLTGGADTRLGLESLTRSE